jgi:hypothetical protein
MAKTAQKRSRALANKVPSDGTCEPGTPDRRYPVHNDPYHEIVCKCIDGNWVCMQVSIGATWQP